MKLKTFIEIGSNYKVLPLVPVRAVPGDNGSKSTRAIDMHAFIRKNIGIGIEGIMSFRRLDSPLLCGIGRVLIQKDNG